MAFVPAPQYCPDMTTLNGQFTDRIVNVLPSGNSYIPIPDVVPITKAIPDKVLSAYAMRLNRQILVFAGTEKGLYRYKKDTNSWENLTREGADYRATEKEPWSFTVFGNLLIAVNSWNKPQSLDLKSPDAKFEDLAGNPPQAGGATAWGDFLCLYRLPDNPNRIHWSGLNDATHWEPGKKSCDYQDFPDGDYVQGCSSATDPIILMKTCIYKGNFIAGSPLVFSFKKIHADKGAKSFLSVANRGIQTFFLSESGFCQINSDGMLSSIGSSRVDRSIFAKFGNDILDYVRGTVDPVYNRVYWAIRPSAGTQIILVYDWEIGRWSTIETDPMTLFSAFTSGYLLDEINVVCDNIDLLKLSLDNKIWQDGAPLLGAFNKANKLCYFTGDNMEATIVTPEMGGTNGQMSYFYGVYCDIDTADALLSVGMRHLKDKTYPMRWGREYHSSYHTGRFNARGRSRYFRFKVRIPAGTKWSHYTGLDFELQPAGDR